MAEDQEIKEAEGEEAEKAEGQEVKEAEGQELEEKPLDKMTATELREVAKGMPEITGAHGMKKPDLLSAIKKARGIEDTAVKEKDVSVQTLKKQIKAYKVKRKEALEAKDSKTATIYRRRISRLKKKTRRAA